MTNLPDRVDHSAMRISDADREEAVAIVHQATGEGRLDLAEADLRLQTIYEAKTYGDLEKINADLPQQTTRTARANRTIQVPRSRWAVAIMGGFQRTGSWVVPRKLTTLAFWGGGQLDLREAVFGPEPITIRSFVVMGGIEILLPENAQVQVNGVGIMGGFGQEAEGQGPLDGPTVVVSGFAFWGGVSIRNAPPDDEADRRPRAVSR